MNNPMIYRCDQCAARPGYPCIDYNGRVAEDFHPTRIQSYVQRRPFPPSGYYPVRADQLRVGDQVRTGYDWVISEIVQVSPTMAYMILYRKTMFKSYQYRVELEDTTFMVLLAPPVFAIAG